MSKPQPLINDPRWAERVVNNAAQETYEATIKEKNAEIAVLRRNLKAVIVSFGDTETAISKEMYDVADDCDLEANHNGSAYELRLVRRRDRDSVLRDVVSVKPEYAAEPIGPSEVDHSTTV